MWIDRCADAESVAHVALCITYGQFFWVPFACHLAFSGSESVSGSPRQLSGRVCLPTQETQETWARSPGREDPWKETATPSSIL